MSAGTVVLDFDKAISPLTLNPNQVQLQSVPNHRFGPYVDFEGCNLIFGIGSYANSLQVFLSLPTLNYMKDNGIGLNAETSLLAWSNTFVADYNGNWLQPQWDTSVLNGSPRLPNYFTSDVISPELQRWYIDRTTSTILLYFSEPVTLLNLNDINVYVNEDSEILPVSTIQILSNTSISSVLDTQFTAELSLVLFCNISTQICPANAVPNGKLLLTITSDAVQDRALIPNFIEPITLSHPLLESAPGK
jgi:hypothetical protein